MSIIIMIMHSSLQMNKNCLVAFSTHLLSTHFCNWHCAICHRDTEMNMCPPPSGGLGERQSCTKGRVSVKTGLIPGAVRTNTAQV